MIDQVGTKEEHEAVAEMLPWFINGSLTGVEAARVEAHLQRCQNCHEHLEFLRAVGRNGIEQAPAWQASPAHFAGILAEVERFETQSGSASQQKKKAGVSFMQRLKRGFRQTPGAVRWTLAVESFVLAALVMVLVVPQLRIGSTVSGDYQTLSDADSVSKLERSARFRILFNHDGMAISDLVDLLKQVRGQIVEGPTQLGFFTVAVEKGDADAAKAALQKHPNIRLVQKME